MWPLNFREWKSHVDISAARHYEKTREFDIDDRMPDSIYCRKWTSDRVKFADMNDEQLMVYWRRYYDFAQQQRHWTQRIMENDILARMLAKLTGLESASVASEAPESYRGMPEPLWLNLWTKTLVLTSWDPCIHGKDNAAALHVLLRSMRNGGPEIRLKEVSVQISGRRFWDHFACQPFGGFGPQRLYRQPFEHVKDLNFDIEMNISNEMVVHRATREIAHWLSSSQIEKLKLHLRNPQRKPLRILQFLANNALALRKLKELCLGIEVGEDELSTFFQQTRCHIEGTQDRLYGSSG